MPDERLTNDEPAAVGEGEEELPLAGDAPAEHDPWLEEAEELPARPRRRVLTPLPLALLGALTIAIGFIAGVLVEKGQGSSSGAGAAGGAIASRLASLRGGSSSAGTGSGSASSSSTSSGLGGAGAASGARGLAGTTTGGAGSGTAQGSASATLGQVAYAGKGTLYVTTSEGNTVKVTAAPGASVTKTVKASLEGVHPGETVLVAGATEANGAIAASSIRVGSLAGGLGGGGAGLFAGTAGGSSSGGGASSSIGASGASGAAGGGEPQLFGKG